MNCANSSERKVGMGEMMPMKGVGLGWFETRNIIGSIALYYISDFNSSQQEYCQLPNITHNLSKLNQ